MYNKMYLYHENTVLNRKSKKKLPNHHDSLSSLSPDEIFPSGVNKSLHDDLVLRQEAHGALELPSA